MIGGFTEQIRFEHAVRVKTASGGYTESWEDIATDPTIYAKVEAYSSGKEVMRARQAGFEQPYRVQLYARVDLKTDYRIVWGTRILEIVSIAQPAQCALYMSLIAAEKVLDA